MMRHCLPQLNCPSVRFLGAMLLTLAANCTAGGAEPPAARPEKNEAAERLQQFYRKIASAYEVRYQNTANTQLVLQPDPAMHWSSINEYGGSVFVWTHRGRPELIGTIFSFSRAGSSSEHVVHEFYAFSASGVAVSAPGGLRWEPTGDVGLKLVPDAPSPAETPAQRLVQVRNLARQFTAHMNRRGDRWELRLLPQPVHKYDGGGEEILGGAVFAFVAFVTDPDLVLLLEARRTPEGPKWHYYPARFSDKSLFLEYRNQPVWQSLRTGHGTSEPSTVEPQYRVLREEDVRLPASGPPEPAER